MEESDLIKRLKNNEGEAFAMLFNLYAQRVHDICLAYTRNSEDSRDLVQETFVRIYMGIDDFKCDCSLKTWISKIAENICKNHIDKSKYKKRSAQLIHLSTLNDFSEEIADWKNANPLDEIINTEQIILLKESIQKLPKNQKMALILKAYENNTYKEIAQKMGKNIPSIKMLIRRAKINIGIIMQKKF